MSIILATRKALGTRRRPGFITAIAALFLVLVLAIALFGPVIAPYSPTDTDLRAVNAGPSASHWLGTDEVGRDTLSRVIDGTRTSLIGPVVVMLIATLLGTAIAFVAVWHGGRVDSLLGVTIDVNLAFPALLLAVLAAAIFGPGLLAPAIAMSIAYVPYCARQIRGALVKERSLPYIEALEVQGLGGLTIVFRHLLPNVGTLVLALAALSFGYAMVDLAAISFLGLGVQPPDADWGTMVAQGQLGIQQGKPLGALTAGGMIVLTVVALNVIGESIAAKSVRGAER